MNTPPPPPSPPRAPAPTPPRRLVRMEDEGKIAGVAAGLGWYFGIDPVLVRIALVVLTIGTGLGIPAYIIAWVVLPKATSVDKQHSPPPRPGDGRHLGLLVIGTVVALVLLGSIDLFSGPVMTAAVLIGVGVLLFTDASSLGLGTRRPGGARRFNGGPTPPWAAGPHGHQGTEPGPSGAPDPSGAHGPAGSHGWQGWHGPWASHSAWHGSHEPTPPSQPAAPGQPSGRAAAGGQPTPPTPPPPPPGPTPESAYAPYAGAWRPAAVKDEAPPRPKSFLGGLAVAAWLVTIGIAALLDRIGVVALTPVRVVALTVTVAGIALVIGTLFGRARGLIVVGIMASLLLVPMAALQSFGVPISGSMGERAFTPATVEDVAERYDLLFGSQTIDLTELALQDGETVEIRAGLTAGELIIRVPEEVEVHARGTLQGGEINVLGEVQSGTSLTFNEAQPGTAEGAIDIEVDVLFGEVSVIPVERR